MSYTVYKSVSELKGFSVKNCAPMPEPSQALMCAPGHCEARGERNPFAAGNAEPIRPQLARKQWLDVRDAFIAAGMKVTSIEAAPGLSDTSFCADQAFVGLTAKLERLCVARSPRYPSRRPEAAAFEAWFRGAGYRVASLKDLGGAFAGAADAIWHPGRRLIWGGYGFRTDAAAYAELARAFAAPVAALKLVNEKFPRLNTCFCPLTQEAALIYPAAFDAAGIELIFRLFQVIITASEPEAARQLVCGAAIVRGRTAIIQRGAPDAARHVAALGLQVAPVDAAEFIKSGLGINALKMFVY